MSWIPQHLFAAICLVSILQAGRAFIPFRWRDRNARLWLAYASIAVSAAIGSSTYLGIIFCTTMAAVLIVLLIRAKFRLFDWQVIAAAIPVALTVAIVYLPGLTLHSGGGVLKLWLNPPNSSVVQIRSPADALDSLVLFWIQYLFLMAAPVLVPGLFGFFFLRSRQTKGLRLPFAFFVFGGCLGAQFVKSVAHSNDFASRAVILPYFLLTALAAAFLAGTPRRSGTNPRGFQLAAALSFGLLALGLLTSPYPDVQKQYGGDAVLLGQSIDCWKSVQQQTGRDDLVQSNPSSMLKLPFPPGNVSLAMFSDRRSAYFSPEMVRAYAVNVNAEQKDALRDFMSELFGAGVSESILQRAAQQFKLAALVLFSTDEAWGKPVWDNNHEYRRIYDGGSCKAYVLDKKAASRKST